jgi:hypothetical protein
MKERSSVKAVVFKRKDRIAIEEIERGIRRLAAVRRDQDIPERNQDRPPGFRFAVV